MKKHKKITIIASTFLLIVVAGAGALLYNSEFWPQAKPTLALPFPDDNPPTGMEPMGETINHANAPGGHPGIDFQWDEVADLTASMDGRVSKIYETNEHGYHEWNVDIKNGKYVTRYKELVEYNDTLKVGDKVKTGDYIGSVGGDNGTKVSRQLHWEFGYAKIITSEFDRMCPTFYLSDGDAQKLERIWQDANYKFRDKFPDLCSGAYKES